METFCRYYNQQICSSCDLINYDYVDQINLKEQRLLKALEGLALPSMEATIRSPVKAFRNKAKFTVTGTLEKPVIGLTGEGNIDQGRELLECSLHVSAINQKLPELKNFIRLAGLIPYSISERKGELKGIILFHSETSGESYLRFIVRSKESLDRVRKFKAYLTDRFPDLNCISVNIQPIPHAILEGEEEIFITEATSINHKLSTVTLSLNPRAFVQTNQKVAEKLYATAANWVRESRLQKFMELFCGQGAFSFFTAPFISQSLGIEINPLAVEEANKTARRNNLSHLSFRSADASNVVNEIRDFKPDIILVNPPRRGIAEATEMLLQFQPRRILYSSCNYETLAKDLKKLDQKYEIRRLQIFDMFPHTSHFETLVELALKDDET